MYLNLYLHSYFIWSYIVVFVFFIIIYIVHKIDTLMPWSIKASLRALSWNILLKKRNMVNIFKHLKTNLPYCCISVRCWYLGWFWETPQVIIFMKIRKMVRNLLTHYWLNLKTVFFSRSVIEAYLLNLLVSFEHSEMHRNVFLNPQCSAFLQEPFVSKLLSH